MKQRYSRRKFLRSSALAVAAPWCQPAFTNATTATKAFELVAKPGQAQLVPEEYGPTDVWCFNDQVPGPEIRVRQGDRLRIDVHNQLEEPTTIHWHGLRIPHGMDGVPYLTQEPIAPGQRFSYEFDVPDAGTFWYHPHQQSAIQVGRGLYGPLIVEERSPIEVDRDVTWVLDDWRLMRSAQIADDFNQAHDLSHAGRIGNTVTINGAIPETFVAHQGERLRLRLINAANARIFALNFNSHLPQIIAIDGQPITPHSPADNRIIIGPAMRIDLILDMTGDLGKNYPIVDDYYRRDAYSLLDLTYTNTRKRQQPLDTMIALPANPVPEPDLTQAEHHEIAFDGGAMSGMTGAEMDGKWQDIRTLSHSGKFWAINGVVATGHILEPLLVVNLGKTIVLTLINHTAWPHPIHLHGHSFRVLSRDNQPVKHRPLQDTVLIDRKEKVEIAFVADNPGDWMFHCHILEHQASGMMGIIRVT